MLGIVANPEMAAQFTGWDGLVALPGRGFCRGGRSLPTAVTGRS